MPSSPRSAKPRPDLLLTIEGAEVRFEWRGDRWAHAVRFDPAAGGSMVGLWHSIEGPGDTSGDDRWPASPVLVELHSHPAGG